MIFVPAEAFLMPALVALIAAALAGRALRHGRRPLAPGRAPLCGACGYDTRGLATLTCPECGSDLRIVGIGAAVARRAPRLIHFVAAAVFLLFLMFAVQTTLTNIWMPMLPAAMEYSNDIRVTSRANPSRSFTIAAVGRGGDVPPTVTIEMRVRGGGGGGGGGGGPFTLVYDPAREPDFGPKNVLDWMSASANVTDPAAPKEAALVAGLARKVARFTRGRAHADWAHGGGGGSRSTSGGAGIFGSFTENYDARPSHISRVAFHVLRVVWAILGVALLIVLFRAIVLPRGPAPAFTPPPARD